MLDSATATCQALHRVAPTDRCDAHLLLRQGRAPEAVTAMKARPPTVPEEMLILAEALAWAGDTTAARRQLSVALAAAGPRYVREDYVAFAYLAVGDTTRTLEWLDRGLTAEAANMAWLNRNWRFRSLYGNPRFAAILRKAGLQPMPGE
jgi:hypothetical protein